jgi:diguanylate cyclase (GGDEF)-like protein
VSAAPCRTASSRPDVGLDEADVVKLQIIEPSAAHLDGLDRTAVRIGQHISLSILLRAGSDFSTCIVVSPELPDKAIGSIRTGPPYGRGRRASKSVVCLPRRSVTPTPSGDASVLYILFVSRPGSIRDLLHHPWSASFRIASKYSIAKPQKRRPAATPAPISEDALPRSLDVVVTSVAVQLMEATASNAGKVSERVLAQLVEQFEVDASFLRHHDEKLRASTLIAEWPPRPDIPDPDPLTVIYFAQADPVFALCEHLKKPTVIRPEPANHHYHSRIEQARPVESPSVAAAPLVSGAATTGVLGFVKFGDRDWEEAEINALEAIASLFAQLQARIAAEGKLRYLAEHDDLTGLHNRRALISYLEERLASGRPGPVAALYLDLDRLKSINDYLGHTAGDRFIRLFAQRLRVRIGCLGMIARLGGDEFVVVPNEPMSAEAAESFARKLQTMVQNRVLIAGELITRTVSIGVAVGMPGRDNTSDLLRRADQAALTVKRLGGNQVAVATSDMSVKGALDNDVELHLQRVIADDSLLLHYLPEIDMRTGDVMAAEALVRWQHPTRGLLLPDSFISVAESVNLASELGRWVMRTACSEFSEWRSRGVGRNATLRLNVSPFQLVTDGFVRSVADVIDEFGIDAGSVCLEITERVVVHDIDSTQKTLAGLKEIGVQIAIDDFGTGYAVLSHLKSLPVDMLKIDTSFVRELGRNKGDLAIVRAIIGLAGAFNLQLVAEGVETEAAAMTLLRHGCPRAQGFLLSQPLAGEAMAALLSIGRVSMPFSATASSLATPAMSLYDT